MAADTAQPASAAGQPGRGLPTHVAAQPLDYGPEWLHLVTAAEEQLLLDQAPHLTPLGCLGEPGDIADIVALLASDRSRWITGQTLHAGGGRF
ncbi:SDR family oxidoreductase [Streptomyces lutosisoli]|uniref:SDR family oxidoreductase n=1 Tax=Streptomyces lutosisoli TaxID=2665721 RepID=A0ABW2VSX2_9ACTN